MQYTSKYQSPLGEIIIAADEKGLTGLWFVGQKYFALHLDKENKEKETEILKSAKKWLDVYSLWTNNNLWRNCRYACQKKRN